MFVITNMDGTTVRVPKALRESLDPNNIPSKFVTPETYYSLTPRELEEYLIKDLSEQTEASDILLDEVVDTITAIRVFIEKITELSEDREYPINFVL